MVTHMKTTIEIADALLERAKRTAAREKKPLRALVEEGLRKIDILTARHGVAMADWPDQPIDPFFNVNTPEDAERAERIALQHN